MKKILSSILALFLALPAYAENVGIQNEALKTLANTAGHSTLLATDKQGRLILGSSFNGVFAEDTAHTTGDKGQFVLGVANPGGATTFAATGDYAPIGINANGNVNTHLFGYDSTLSPARPEDSAFSDQGMFMVGGGVNNRSLSIFNSTNGDTTPQGVGDYGNAFASILYDAALGNQSPVKAEDGTFGDTDKVITVGALTQEPLTVDQSTNNDVAIFKLDRAGRQYVTFAGPSETFYSCGTATASTSDVAMKAAVASNRMYVTSITCKSTSATVATSLDFKDGITVMAVGGISQMATTAPGSFNAVFPVPLRGSVNTALNFATNVSTSSVTCCAQGYISTN